MTFPLPKGDPQPLETEPAVIVREQVENLVVADRRSIPFASCTGSPNQTSKGAAQELAAYYQDKYDAESPLITAMAEITAGDSGPN